MATEPVRTFELTAAAPTSAIILGQDVWNASREAFYGNQRQVGEAIFGLRIRKAGGAFTGSVEIFSTGLDGVSVSEGHLRTISDSTEGPVGTFKVDLWRMLDYHFVYNPASGDASDVVLHCLIVS